MAFAPFIVALGDSPEVELPVASTVDIAPADNSVDTNRVRIAGAGTISGLGLACGGLRRSDVLDPEDEAATDDVMTVTKRIAWVPSGAGIVLRHNPPTLSLLGGVDRTITTPAYGHYASDVDGNWQEESYSAANASPTQAGGSLIAFVTYAASGPITIPPHATRAWVRMWAGAGGVGSGDAPSASYSGGSGAPGYLEKFLTDLVPGNTLIYTRGTGGVAGGNGGTATLASGTQAIGTLTANGSLGSQTATTGGTPGTDGGTATGGDVNIKGQRGSSGGLGPPPGGASGLARGTDGSVTGAAGLPGGLIIAWYNDPVA